MVRVERRLEDGTLLAGRSCAICCAYFHAYDKTAHGAWAQVEAKMKAHARSIHKKARRPGQGRLF